MYEFLQKLFSFRDKDLTVILLDDKEPESSNSFEFRPARLFGLVYLFGVAVAVLILVLVMLTPLGTLVYDRQDEQLRQSVIDISQRIGTLQDSLRARDRQLREIQQVLADGEDTTFTFSPVSVPNASFPGESESWVPDGDSEVRAYESFSKREIIFSGILKKAPSFPAPFPVDGSLTRGFNQEAGHYGIDIATEDNAVFQSIADGTVINYDWTINFGYVIQIQHENGVVTIFKHASSLSKNIGDIILKGDIIGTVGNTGTLSTGPHLHIEIWRNGVPQNPLMYLQAP